MDWGSLFNHKQLENWPTIHTYIHTYIYIYIMILDIGQQPLKGYDPWKIRNNDIAHTIAPVFRKKTISGPGVQIGDLKVLIVFSVLRSQILRV